MEARGREACSQAHGDLGGKRTDFWGPSWVVAVGRVEARSCWPLEDGRGQSPTDRGCQRGSDRPAQASGSTCADEGVCPSPSALAPCLTAHELLGFPSADMDVCHVGARPCPPAGGAETTGTEPRPLGVCDRGDPYAMATGEGGRMGPASCPVWTG